MLEIPGIEPMNKKAIASDTTLVVTAGSAALAKLLRISSRDQRDAAGRFEPSYDVQYHKTEKSVYLIFSTAEGSQDVADKALPAPGERWT